MDNIDIKNKPKAFHIIITDRNGNALCDSDSDCIVGAYDVGDGVQLIGFVECNGNALCETCLGAKNSIDTLLKDKPIWALKMELLGLIK